MHYTVLKFVHILLAIIAVGFTTSFGLILARAAKAGPAETMYALRTIGLMSAIAHGAYALLLVTGVWMIYLVGYPYSFTWIYLSLILFTFAFLTGGFVLRPGIAKRINILSSRGPDDPEFLALSKRSGMIGAILGIVSLIILWLMVAKPL